MKAIVNPEVCIGCTLCVGTCPEVFRMDGDKAVTQLNPVPANLQESCKRAAEECPVAAIEISEG